MVVGLTNPFIQTDPIDCVLRGVPFKRIPNTGCCCFLPFSNTYIHWKYKRARNIFRRYTIITPFGCNLFSWPMGTNCAPLLADIFLYSYEADFIQSLLSTGKKHLASRFNLTYRYIDDVLSINYPEFENYLGQMYPAELEIKDTTENPTSASYLDLLLSIGRSGQDLRQTRWFNFHITKFPFLSSNIPSSPANGVFISQLIRYARACSSYECFMLRARRLSSKLLKLGYLADRLKSSFMKFYGRYGDLIQQYEVFLSRSDPWPTVTSQPIRLSNNFMTLIPSLTFTDYEWFPWSICNGCGMPAGNAYPSGHLVPSPIVGLACAPIVETRFRTCHVFTRLFTSNTPRIPLGTFSILLRNFLDITFQLLKPLSNCLAKIHWRGFSTRNAHIVHIVN